MKLGFAALSALLSATTSAAPIPVLVETTDGIIEGKRDTVLNPKLTEFKGVPFAAPPTKHNRFRNPQPGAY